MSSKSCSYDEKPGGLPRPLAILGLLSELFPGLAIASIVGLAAAFITNQYGGPIMLFVLLLGMTLNPVASSPRFVPGIEFATKRILRIGVALLGARITLDQILSLGWAPIAVVVTGVAVTILVGLALGRALGLGARFGVLTGCSVAICGASAAMAISSVLPKGKNDERDTIFTVIGVTTLSTVAMVLYPLICAALGYTDNQAGVFLGGTIHDVAQVVGAGYSVSETAGDAATYTKLMRVALLLPVALAVALAFNRGSEGGGKARPPLFLFAFFALIGLNSAGLITPEMAEIIQIASKVCLVVAIAALGIKTSLSGLLRVGGPSILLIVTETLVLAGLVIGLLALLG